MGWILSTTGLKSGERQTELDLYLNKIYILIVSRITVVPEYNIPN